MHICFVCNEYPPGPHGGTGSSYRDLSESLVEQGHDVTVVGVHHWMEPGEDTVVESIRGVRVIRLSPSRTLFSYRFWSLADRFRLATRLKREHGTKKFDLIEASDYGGWLLFGMPKRIPTIVRIRGSNAFFDAELNRNGDRFEHWLERTALRRASHICAVSSYAGRRTLEVFGMESRDFTVIHNAVDVEMFSPDPDRSIEQGLIVFVNTVRPKKGIEQLLTAMNQVFRKFEGSRLLVIGKGAGRLVNEGTYQDWLFDLVDPEFRSRVEFLGPLDRDTGVVEYLRRANVCCLPSHMETFGIAAIESMAVGTPTIFSQTGPGPEVIDSGVSGFLCNPYDPDDIALKIIMLLADHRLAERLGDNGRTRVVKYFNKEAWTDRNVDFFRAKVVSSR